MELDDDLGAAIDAVATTPRLLVLCSFEDALTVPTDDLADARAEGSCSQALNTLLSLPGTTTAVVTRHDPEQVLELMFLSGSKGGLRVVTPDEVAGLRERDDATAVLAIGVALDAGPDDVVVGVGEPGSDPDDADDTDDPDRVLVEDPEGVAAVLTELTDLRRA